MHVMPVYREETGAYPVAERLGRRGVNLPRYGLMTEEDVQYVARQIREITASGA